MPDKTLKVTEGKSSNPSFIDRPFAETGDKDRVEDIRNYLQLA